MLVVDENWVVRITGNSMTGTSATNISLIWYVAAQGVGHHLSLETSGKLESGDGVKDSVLGVRGKGSDVGDYTVIFRDQDENENPTFRIPRDVP